MKLLPDISYIDSDLGIEFLKTHNFNYYQKDDEKTIFHVYWYGKINRNQVCCINSYLATQNLEKTELWVWLDYDTIELSKNSIPKNKNVVVKEYNPNIESKDTPLENNNLLNQNKYLKFRSDLARIIFLYKYGGVYYDLDMILLKNFEPLLGIEFCYKWSTQKGANNGLLRFFKKSKILETIILKYVKFLAPFQKPGKNFNYQVNDIHKNIYTEELDIMCFPSIMFDPVWMILDTKLKSKYSNLTNFDDFFKYTEEDVNKFFDNQIFAYHWHSRSNVVAEKNSYFDKIEKQINLKISSSK